MARGADRKTVRVIRVAFDEISERVAGGRHPVGRVFVSTPDSASGRHAREIPGCVVGIRPDDVRTAADSDGGHSSLCDRERPTNTAPGIGQRLREASDVVADLCLVSTREIAKHQQSSVTLTEYGNLARSGSPPG